MPDLIASTTASPETASAAAPVSAAPVIDSLVTDPAQITAAARADIAAKYEKLYGGASTPQPVAASDVPARGDTASSGSDALIAPPAESVVAAPDRIAQIEEQLAKVTSILTRLAEPEPKLASADVAKPAPTFVDLLKAGDFDGVEELLAGKAAARAESNAVIKAVEMVRVENEVTNFIADLRGKNPDLLPLEELITTKAAQKLEIAQNSGKITSVKEYVDAYKLAVNSATDDARKIVQSIRAAGKTEGQIRNKEVLSSTTIPPNTVEASHTAAASPGPETTSEYMAKRFASNYRMRGLAVA
jgi:hypothetical protein